uniref:Protein-lysine N-trimethyltransferase SMYD5 n=1 Tax=Sus scrofa TaxID=9823 RepID=A0A8D1EHR4_PIG
MPSLEPRGCRLLAPPATGVQPPRSDCSPPRAIPALPRSSAGPGAPRAPARLESSFSVEAILARPDPRWPAASPLSVPPGAAAGLWTAPPRPPVRILPGACPGTGQSAYLSAGLDLPCPQHPGLRLRAAHFCGLQGLGVTGLDLAHCLGLWGPRNWTPVQDLQDTERSQKRVRTMFNLEQLEELEKVFAKQHNLVGKKRAQLAAQLNLTENQGKGLFATQLIRKGETIFVEQPLVAAQFLWNALYRYRACDHCLRALEKAEENAQRLTGKPGQVLPHPDLCTVRKDLHQNCPHCQVMYCSAECRLAAAEQYHQVLCPGPSQDDPLHPLNKLQEAWRSVHYPPETASIMLMARMVATVKQAKDKDRWIRLYSQFCNKTANEEEEIVHKLLGDKFKGQLELLRRLFTEALYEEALSQWFTPDGFRSLFALVGTNGQGIGTSSLSQWVHACDALELKPQDREQLDAFIDQLYKDIEAATGEFLNCEGSGLFVLQSCCNHSCVPNAETSFPENNFLLHVTALEDIKPGEEICISYLDCCQRERSRHSRHKILRENYLFVCSCPKCLAEADEPNMTSEEEEDEEEEEGEPEAAELGDEMTDV